MKNLICLIICFFLILSCNNTKIINFKKTPTRILRVKIDEKKMKISGIEKTEALKKAKSILKKRFNQTDYKIKIKIDNLNEELVVLDYNKVLDNRLNYYILMTGNLEFRFVSESGKEILEEIIYSTYNNENIFNSNGNIKEKYLKKLPAGIIPMFIIDKDLSKSVKMLPVESKLLFDQDDVIDHNSVKLENSKYGDYLLYFDLKKELIEQWADITENAARNNRQIAIITDNLIITNPRVTTKILSGQCMITMPHDNREISKFLGILLRYPLISTPLYINSEEIIGK